jgi:adenylyltransferase/sulfurtransferase
MTSLTEQQIQRYARHIILPEVGGKGQEKLLRSSVLCIGAGGLGSPILLYLAAAGVGRIGLIDHDAIDLSNLQRQILHATPDVGQAKVESARRRVEGLNPDVKIETVPRRIQKDNVLDLVDRYDAVIDGTDNFPTRFLVNDACFFRRKPLIYGSVFRFEGQASVFLDRPDAPCYRCLFPEPPPPGETPSCQEAGILGVVPGVIGVIQATEFVKFVLKLGDSLTGRLLIYNALEMSFRTVKLRKNPDCPLCGRKPSITELIEYDETCEFRASP